MEGNPAVSDVTAHARETLPAPESSLCVPQMLTTRWGLRMSYRQGNSNFFVLQLYYNIVNSLGVHIFASKKQINNICIWCVSGSIVGECSACKRCYLQPS